MESGTVKIFSNSDSPRLRYVAGIILGTILGLEWEVITDRRKAGKNPVINYSGEKVKGSFHIIPASLLYESSVKDQDITVSSWENLPIFFAVDDTADLPFDIFAASFYMLSRYEEYLPFSADEHGRFRASESLASRNGFLRIPVVDMWAAELARALIKKLPVLAFRKNIFRSAVTVDVDEPFEYLGKDVLRSLGGLFRDLGNGHGRAGERYRILSKGEKDPWDVFDFIENENKKYNSPVKFFFPTGDRSKFDRNPSWNNEDYRNLVLRLAGKYDYGCHPSYFSHKNAEAIIMELSRLKKISGTDTDSARFHYLRLSFPGSYSALVTAGIRNDYSMGFHDDAGFRAGIARPFPFYDLSNERETSLNIIPFQLMDATLYSYMKLDHEQARKVINETVSVTRKAGGLFVSIWHNTTLLETPEGDGWRSLFSEMLKSCSNDYLP